MPRFIRTLLLACILFLATGTTIADYPIPSHRYLADPAVLVHDGRVYLYCSNDDENVGQETYAMRSLVCISSDDLKNWTDHGIAFQVPTNALWANLSWAPAVVARNNQFYLYFGNGGGGGIGVATSDTPIGPYNDPIGEPLVNWSTSGASGDGMWLFDPYTFIDDDGQAYLYFGGNGENNVRVIKLNRDMISLDGPAMPMSAPAFFEAAWMHKRNDLYYFSYSTNPSNGLRIDYMISDNPVSGFEYAGIVAGQPPSNNNNNHHGIFEFEGNWYHVYHNRFVANETGDPPGYLRNLGIEPLTHNEDGAIQQITYTRDDLQQVKPLDPFSRVEAETMAAQSGVEAEPSSAGGMNLADLHNGDWIQLRGVDFREGSDAFTARVASSASGAIELRLDSLDGTLIGRCEISDTGGTDSWANVNCPIDEAAANGVHDLYLSFVGESEDPLFEFDWWQFQEAPQPPVAPIDVSASAVSSSEIRVDWSASPEASSYTLKRATSSEGPYHAIAEDITDTSYTDSELTEDTAYFYVVAAISAIGSSDDSDSASATPVPNFAEWISAFFPSEDDPQVIGPQADADQDDRANLLEYYMGTDPGTRDGASFSIDSDGGEDLTVIYRRSSKLAAIDARIQMSDDLVNWTNAELAPDQLSQRENYEILQANVPKDDPPIFLRLAVSLPQ